MIWIIIIIDTLLGREKWKKEKKNIQFNFRLAKLFIDSVYFDNNTDVKPFFFPMNVTLRLYGYCIRIKRSSLQQRNIYAYCVPYIENGFSMNFIFGVQQQTHFKKKERAGEKSVRERESEAKREPKWKKERTRKRKRIVCILSCKPIRNWQAHSTIVIHSKQTTACWQIYSSMKKQMREKNERE